MSRAIVMHIWTEVRPRVAPNADAADCRSGRRRVLAALARVMTETSVLPSSQ